MHLPHRRFRSTEADVKYDPNAIDDEPVIVEATVAVDEYKGSIATQSVTSHTDTSAPVQQVAAAGNQVVFDHLGRTSAFLKCPYCDTHTMTIARSHIDGLTIVFVVILLFLFWPLFWVPLCMPACKSTRHKCANCHKLVGETYPCSS